MNGFVELEPLRKDDEFVLQRCEHSNQPGSPSVLLLTPASTRPTVETLRKLQHECSLRDQLDSAWAVRPLTLAQHHGNSALVLEDPGGEILDRLLSAPMEVKQFLRLGVGLATALTGLHKSGLIHKDLKPANVLVAPATGQARLMGFQIASQLAREHQPPEAPELIAGTLAYMAPEQTGRMNRSVDERSDLYALGVTLYEMITGSPPFTASDPMEWVHCHIARQAVPPHERSQNVPVPVSAIIMKLLAKTPEERYQTAAGLESDLRRCLAAWETRREIDDFPLGEHDRPDRLLIPEKLYGREREIATLLASFDRIVKSGTPELVLVSGYSGIGKSSVVNELHKVLVPTCGLFASGKFDQYKRDIPYATLVQAFQSLLRSLLIKSDAELSKWRDALRQALDPNGQLIVDLVPELRLIIGDQPPVPELPLHDARRRFHMVFRRFIGVFARPEHPLALFLDDLQWLDAATLDLIEDVLSQADVRHLMLIGAYRDNEVDATHPLMRKLEAIHRRRGIVHDIVLAPLTREHLEELIVDTLHCEADRAKPLAQLVEDKTGGNPFFAIRFIVSLAEEGLLAFDHGEGWAWDLNRICAKGCTDNVVDLMVGKLRRLPQKSQSALEHLACLGHSADIAILAQLFGTSEEQVHADLWEPVRWELVERGTASYRFVHDRIQEAAYSLIPEESRAASHLRIGKFLAAHTPLEKRDEAIFEIVNQLNRAPALLTSPDEREQFAELNLVAGKRAKASTAYASALNYLTAGVALLPVDSWESRHTLMFELTLNQAECEFLTGALTEAQERLTELSHHATNTVERAIVASLHIDVLTTLDQATLAMAVALEYLRHVGIDWPAHPTEEEARREYERIWSHLGGRAIESVIDLPLMSDPESLATVDVLTRAFAPALYTDGKLLSLVICRAINLSLEDGNCDATLLAYVTLGAIAGPLFGDYPAGYRFGQLGYELVERRGLKRFQARTYLNFSTAVLGWTSHVRSCPELVRRAFDAATKNGDLTCAAYCRTHLIAFLFFAGDPLSDVQREAEHGLAFAQKAQFGFIIDLITAQLVLIETLRGLTPRFGCFTGGQIEELQFEHHLTSNPALALAECWYWIRKLQARYMAGDYQVAMAASAKAQGLLWTLSGFLDEGDYHFYTALCRAASCDSVSPNQRQQHLDTLALHQRQLDIWAQNCPENFGNRAALVGAEIARIEGRLLDAEQLYEKAIRSAHANGFVQNEGLAYEIAARFYAARGFDKIADSYLFEARYCYERWGAEGKVKQLDQLYPHVKKEGPPTSTPPSTILAASEVLDLATVVKVSQAVAGEMVLEKLIDRVLRAAIEQAGAERGLLILTRDDEFQVAAEATTSGNDVAVHLGDASANGDMYPESVVRYVMRTQESVILEDASSQNPFSADLYIIQRRPRSILTLPLINKGKLISILHLENNLTPHVFTADRISVLKVLASQAAISLENTRLYRDLEDRERRIRRLVDANIVGIFSWNLEGQILEANGAFLRMVGYDQEDLVSGRLRWTDLTPPEWLDRDERHWMPELKMSGSLPPFEKEYFRKDGSRVPVLIAAALFEEGGSAGVAFALDLSMRKRAEEALRRSETYLAEGERLTHSGSWGLDILTGEPLHSSAEHTRLFGFDPEKGMPTFEEFLHRVHPEDQERVLKTFQTLLRSGGDMDMLYRIAIPGGPVRYMHAIGHPVLKQSGPRGEYAGITIDITERKRAEEELRRNEMEFRQVLDFTPQHVAVYGARREPLYANRTLLDYLGITLEEWQRFPGELVHPDDRERVNGHFNHALYTGAGFELELRITQKGDDSYRWFLARCNPMRDEYGQIVRWYVAGTDIEDRKRAEERLRQENVALRAEIDKASMFEEIIGASAALQAALASVAKVAPTDSSVLITGETGTGKELIARAIHKRSRRSNRRFVSVNCAALAPSLISSELFGHEKGAFTGATERRIGRFELADGGTIFLDEVGEIPLDTQVALLRVLQEQEFERVGGTQAIKVDVRVIAATNRDLKAAGARGAFRADLYYRLNVFPIEVPPLRERKDDILMLVEYFIQRHARRMGKSIRSIDKSTLELFQSYPWPGNIRELQNVVERSVILSSSEVLRLDKSLLPSASSERPVPVQTSLTSGDERGEERKIIEAALARSKGRVEGPGGAAAKLGIPSSTLRSKIKTLKISKTQFKYR